MRLPQDLANLLAVAIRDLIWYKKNVRSFLKECGVPEAIMVEVNRQRETQTIPLVHFVLDELAGRGDDGFEVARQMLTRIYYWKDIHTVPVERKGNAVASLKAVRDGYSTYQSQQEFQKEQKEQERKSHEERVERRSMQGLDHKVLKAFRDEFDTVFSIANPQERGNRFQDLMNRVFDYYCEQSKGAFNRTGEQIDGLFYFDNHWYFVEIRWKKDKAKAADVSVLRDRAIDAYGGDTKALFISFEGFSADCLESLQGRGDERVILMDGYDLRCVLDCQLAFDVLVAEKQAEIVKNKRPFIGAAQILAMRSK